jgi:16S rRNA (cytosine1402-N4)-methyltransferase
VEHANFVELPEVLGRFGIDRFGGLLADLGFASNQVDDPARGLSFRGFRGDGPLDMRLDASQGPTAAEIVNTLPERELADLIYRYGEERLSRRIARKIAERRAREPIETTSVLAELVRSCYPPAQRGPRARIDPATRTFQALRIAVNDELGALERLLAMLPEYAAPGANAVIISFHSLEDRLVKHTFAGFERDGLGTRLTRKPLEADEQECADNPRARSAKLRAFAFAG